MSYINNHKNITPLTTIPKHILIKKIKQSSHKSLNPFKISYSQQNKSNNKSNQQKIPLNSNNHFI